MFCTIVRSYCGVCQVQFATCVLIMLNINLLLFVRRNIYILPNMFSFGAFGRLGGFCLYRLCLYMILVWVWWCVMSLRYVRPCFVLVVLGERQVIYCREFCYCQFVPCCRVFAIWSVHFESLCELCATCKRRNQQ